MTFTKENSLQSYLIYDILSTDLDNDFILKSKHVGRNIDAYESFRIAFPTENTIKAMC